MKLIRGDCLAVLRRGTANAIDAVVTDPPAGIGFVGKDWDGDKGGRDQWVAWLRDVMAECYRVLKPGGHALVWALPRTSHWTATAIEDAGFEIRDVVMHLFGTGFPKSLDVSKAINKAPGAEREVGGPATDAARQWQGWGTALKPAAEHWILARKPLIGTVASNVLVHGVGALNIDGCRIGTGEGVVTFDRHSGDRSREQYRTGTCGDVHPSRQGRWPAHLTLDESAAAMLDEQTAHLKPGGQLTGNEPTSSGLSGTVYGRPSGSRAWQPYGDSGGASRFFYVAKPSKAEKGEGNTHPTVKSVALMRWLVRLVAPPGGIVLDPFMGSGTTGLAALAEGFDFVGIEQSPEYFDIAQRRIGAVTEGAK